VFNCKYNLLGAQKSLTPGNTFWWESCHSYVQSPCDSPCFHGHSADSFVDQQCFRMSLIACLPGQQPLTSPSTGCDCRRDCRALQWPNLPCRGVGAQSDRSPCCLRLFDRDPVACGCCGCCGTGTCDWGRVTVGEINGGSIVGASRGKALSGVRRQGFQKFKPTSRGNV